MDPNRSLSALRTEFGRTRLLSLPIAGVVVWSIAGILGTFLQDADSASLALFFCLPAVFPLSLLISRFTGDDPFGAKGQNELDRLFLHGLLMANLVWCIAIPVWMLDPATLPLTAGILAGLMWVPLSWILDHWVGIFHAVSRSVLVALAWIFFPSHRFTLIPAIIVLVYLVSIVALARRSLPASDSRAATS